MTKASRTPYVGARVAVEARIFPLGNPCGKKGHSVGWFARSGADAYMYRTEHQPPGRAFQ